MMEVMIQGIRMLGTILVPVTLMVTIQKKMTMMTWMTFTLSSVIFPIWAEGSVVFIVS
jgi:uncharacterized membrane protein